MWEQKVATYADDLLLYITNPLTSLPTSNLMVEFIEFKILSKFKINTQKSEILKTSLPISEYNQIKEEYPFIHKDFVLTYLRINIPRGLLTLSQHNFVVLLEEITHTLQNGYNFDYSWIGRCNIIIMAIFPKVLYLFQNLLICIP